MNTYTVTIGRNIGNRPMSDTHWLSFQANVRNTLTRDVLTPADVIETHYGTGEWEGVTEESAMITRRSDSPLSADQLSRIYDDLKVIADDFRQDAIAFTQGQSFLIHS